MYVQVLFLFPQTNQTKQKCRLVPTCDMKFCFIQVFLCHFWLLFRSIHYGTPGMRSKRQSHFFGFNQYSKVFCVRGLETMRQEVKVGSDRTGRLFDFSLHVPTSRRLSVKIRK